MEWNLRGETKTGIANFSNFTKPKNKNKKVHYKSIVARERHTAPQQQRTHARLVEVDIDLLAAQPVVTVQSERCWIGMGGKSFVCLLSSARRVAAAEWAGKLIGIATNNTPDEHLLKKNVKNAAGGGPDGYIATLQLEMMKRGGKKGTRGKIEVFIRKVRKVVEGGIEVFFSLLFFSASVCTG